MIKKLLFIALILPITMVSQITYKSGYFVSDSGEKVNCIIQDLDWTNNPSSFKYKLNETSTLQKRSIDNTKEFAYGNTIFKRYTVPFARMANGRKEYDTEPNLSFEEKTLFLKVLVDGTKQLLSAIDNTSQVFYIKNIDSDPIPLIYHQYINSSYKRVTKDNYKQQLKSFLGCGVSAKKVANLSYEQRSLIELILNHDPCDDETIIVNSTNNRKKAMYLYAGVGVLNGMISTNYRREAVDIEANNTLFVTAGLEYNIPLYRNKISLLSQLTSHTLKASLTDGFNIAPSVIREDTVEIEYNSIDFAFGSRFYSYLNEEWRIFIELSYVIPVLSKGSYSSESGDNVDEFKDQSFLSWGIGASYKDFQVTIQPALNREYNFNIENKYSTIQLGYRF